MPRRVELAGYSQINEALIRPPVSNTFLNAVDGASSTLIDFESNPRMHWEMKTYFRVWLLNSTTMEIMDEAIKRLRIGSDKGIGSLEQLVNHKVWHRGAINRSDLLSTLVPRIKGVVIELPNQKLGWNLNLLVP